MLEQSDVVIPALNEEQNIGRIVSVFKDHPQVSNVFVIVDDATTDYTTEVAYEAGATCHRLTGVTGKGQLLQWGITLTKTPRIIFSDGDYTRFASIAVDYLFTIWEPYSMRLVVPRYPSAREWKNGGLNVPFTDYAWSVNTGLRSFPRDLVVSKEGKIIDLHGYLVETQLNQWAKMRDYPIVPIYCPSVHAPLRFTKRRLEAMEADRRWGLENGVFQ